jgi:hypothetical protein
MRLLFVLGFNPVSAVVLSLTIMAYPAFALPRVPRVRSSSRAGPVLQKAPKGD